VSFNEECSATFPLRYELLFASCQFVLLPPEGRAVLEEPYRADITLRNDVKCEVAFTKPSYEVRGSLDTLLVPVRRSGPKGRPVSVAYKTKGLWCKYFYTP